MGNGGLNILTSNLLCSAGGKIGTFIIDRVNGEIARALMGRGVELVIG